MPSWVPTASPGRPPVACAQMARMWAGSSPAGYGSVTVVTAPDDIHRHGQPAVAGHRAANAVPPFTGRGHGGRLTRFPVGGFAALVEGAAGAHEDRQLVVEV